MNISFDLDSTLIPNGNEFTVAYKSRIAGLFGIENIRKDAPKLIAELQHKGHDIHIYTTSYRSERKIRLYLKYYGIKVCKVINQIENRKVLKEHNKYSSKYPPAFGFDVHIDDLEGVGIESETHNFKTIIIKPTNEKWAEKVIKEIEFYENEYFNSIHFERMKMMQSYFKEMSKSSNLYIPEYNATKTINSILESNCNVDTEIKKRIESELSKVNKSEHYGGSHWHDYEIHTNSILKHRMK